MRIGCFVVTLLAMQCLSGCGGPNSSQLRDMARVAWIPKQADWPELVSLERNPGGDMNAFSLAKLERQVDEAGVEGMSPRFVAQLGSADFQERLKKFEESPIPSEFKDEKRERTKTEVVKAIGELVSLSKVTSTPAKKLMEKCATLLKLVKCLHFVSGQVAPTGEEAKKYSSVSPLGEDPCL